MAEKQKLVLPQLDDIRASNFLVGVMKKKLRKLIQSRPKTFFKYMLNTRDGYMKTVIEDYLNDPVNHKMKKIIHKSSYYAGGSYEPLIAYLNRV